jgi:taurine dioxygenase
MSLNLSPLPGQSDFGVVVTGFEIGMLDDPAIRKEIHDLWIDRGVVVFRNYDGLEQQLKLSELFGHNESHPMLRDADMPDEMKISVNIDEEVGGTYLVDGEERSGWLAWHKDSIYTDEINHGGVLWSINVPERGGETGFIDQIAAWEALPDDLKARCEGLNLLNVYTLDSLESKFGNRPEKRTGFSKYMSTTIGFASRPRVVHPMVFTQPETGRKVLNVCPWFAAGIEGMENEEGDALLREVIAHLLAPGREYYHRWVNGEMVLWDNWRMLHCAQGTPVGMKRLMRRTTIFGDYALGRKEKAAEPA